METETYVQAIAEAIGMPIPPEYLAGTTANFERSTAVAKQLMEFPLPINIQPAPNYEP